MRDQPTRRDLLKASLLAAVGAGLGSRRLLAGAGTSQRAEAGATGRRRSLRFAHLTDFHIQHERAGDAGVAKCLVHMAALSEGPELVITGGDMVFDVMRANEARATQLWDLFLKTMRDGCGVPVRHCLGNHDVWGWNKSKSHTTGHEARWGKRWALDALGMERPYYSFDRGAWRIIVLDSVQPHNDSYTAHLDEEQYDWLDKQLRDAGKAKHVMLVSHIPIYSVSAIDLEAKTDENRWGMPGGVMHTDAQRLAAMFRERGNVRLAVSGHIHKNDRIDYDGVTYICDGAVCGSWWKGPEDRSPEGYGVFDLYEDGSFDHAYLEYGWTAQPE